MRRKLLLGNWKMNKTQADAKAFAMSSIELCKLAHKHQIDVGVAPTYLGLQTVKSLAPELIVAAQNVHFMDHGAYTGEISIPMLLELGINWVIIGHSERRTYDNETNEKCNLKIKALLLNHMTPVYCVGESLAQFDAHETKAFIAKQIKEGLQGLTSEDAKHIVIAYEPIWSIGTGKNASKEIAEDICGYIRELLHEEFGDVSEEIRILYGGSVKPENVKEYLSMKDIDGALVGGASLKVESFAQLVNNII